MGGKANVTVKLKDGKLSVSVAKGRSKFLSEKQAAAVSYIQGIIADGAQVNFRIIGKDHHDERNQTLAFNFVKKGQQDVDIHDLPTYSQFRDPLNIVVHEIAEQFNSVKNDVSDYWANHEHANEVEFQITGKKEENYRTTEEHLESIYKPLTNIRGHLARFDYVDAKGNYIETREADIFNGNYRRPKTVNKNTPTERENEKKFKTAPLQKN